METLHLLGVLLISLLSLTLQPPSSLISVASKTKKCWKLKQSTLKGGDGRGSGKGLNSTYGRHWKLEKVFFNESVSTNLQLVVGLQSLHVCGLHGRDKAKFLVTLVTNVCFG